MKLTDGLKIWLHRVNGGRVVCLLINCSTVQETTNKWLTWLHWEVFQALHFSILHDCIAVGLVRILQLLSSVTSPEMELIQVTSRVCTPYPHRREHWKK